MECAIRKVRQRYLPSVPNLLRVIAIPATVKFHKGLCPAVLRQEGNQIRVVGLRVGNVVIGHMDGSLVVPEATSTPAV